MRSPSIFHSPQSGAPAPVRRRDDLALADLNQLIQLDPKTAQNYSMRAEVYEKKNLKDLAIADYKTAQTLDPTNAFAKAGLARLGATP